MGSQRAHIVLPDDLIAEIDSVVGPRGRSAFLTETARAELKRRRLLAFLENPAPAWRKQDHPELSRGTGTWVRQQRRASETRSGRKSSRQRSQ